MSRSGTTPPPDQIVCPRDRGRGAPVTAAATPPGSAAPSSPGAALLRVAWLAVVLGLVMEGILLLAGVGLGESFGLGKVTADLVKTVSWSAFVCVGLAIGTTLAKSRVPFAGLAGLLAAPTAFEVSRTVHKGTLEALSVSGDATSPPALLVAVIKGVEYGCLGMAVAWLGSRPWGGAAAHVGLGLLIGTVFGGTLVAVTLAYVPAPTTAALVSQGLNELLFPVGCSLVLFSAGTLEKRISSHHPDRGAPAGHGP
jgi:hypothetical protein